MEQLKHHMWLAAALAMSLPLSAAADGNNADGNKPNPTLESVQRALLNRIDTLQTALEGKIAALDRKVALQADVNTLKTDVNTLKTKRSVAILQVVPRSITRSTNHLFNPRYFVMGSTIKGFHDTVAFGTEITQSDYNYPLPAGSYLFELQQPHPPDDDATCAIPQPFRGSGNIHSALTTTAATSTNPLGQLDHKCRVMRIHTESGIHRKLESGAAILKFDGTLGFQVIHKIPTSWITAERPVATFYGSVRITKLE